jgi:hypothetical protein
MEHLWSGSWREKDKETEAWLNKHESLWKPSPREMCIKDVALCCIARQEDRYLQEWIDHHLLMGVKRLFGKYVSAEEKMMRRYEASARQLLNQFNRAQTTGAPTLSFDEEAMTMTTPNGSEEVVPYTAMEYVIEEEDLILITFGTKVTVIRQTEIVDGDIAEFLPFMADKTTVIYLHPEAHTVTEEGDGE